MKLPAHSYLRIMVDSVISKTECTYSGHNSKRIRTVRYWCACTEKFSRNREVATAVPFSVSVFISRII